MWSGLRLRWGQKPRWGSASFPPHFILLLCPVTSTTGANPGSAGRRPLVVRSWRVCLRDNELVGLPSPGRERGRRRGRSASSSVVCWWSCYEIERRRRARSPEADSRHRPSRRRSTPLCSGLPPSPSAASTYDTTRQEISNVCQKADG